MQRGEIEEGPTATTKGKKNGDAEVHMGFGRIDRCVRMGIVGHWIGATTEGHRVHPY